MVEPKDYWWLFDDLRSAPGDSLSREQYRMVLTRVGSELEQLPPNGIPEEALSDIEQYVLRLWFALTGEDSRIEGIEGHDGWIVDAYRIYVDLHDDDYPLTLEQRRTALGELRRVLDALVATQR